jgi:hypothetical protein
MDMVIVLVDIGDGKIQQLVGLSFVEVCGIWNGADWIAEDVIA